MNAVDENNPKANSTPNINSNNKIVIKLSRISPHLESQIEQRNCKLKDAQNEFTASKKSSNELNLTLNNNDKNGNNVCSVITFNSNNLNCSSKLNGSYNLDLNIRSTKKVDNIISNSKLKNDFYCWICHTDGNVIKCCLCPRVFHLKCLSISQDRFAFNYDEARTEWTCLECQKLTIADEEKTALNKVNGENFYMMLSHAVNRLKYDGSKPFQKSVDINQYPDYYHYIVNPIDISVLDQKISKKEYVSLESLIQDMKWIVHNCIVFNGAQNKLTSIAKSLLRMLKHEVSEIEVCSDCYLNSILKPDDNWFSEPCRIPHMLVWAKIRGFPFWPAKALRAVGTDLDVRFFGAHDRSMVPINKCYWLSKDFPSNVRNHRLINMQPSIKELNLHIKKLENVYGPFKYAPPLSLIDLKNPFVFLEKFKDYKCLPVNCDNLKVNPKRNLSNSNATNIKDSFNLVDECSNKNDCQISSKDVKSTAEITKPKSLETVRITTKGRPSKLFRRSRHGYISKSTSKTNDLSQQNLKNNNSNSINMNINSSICSSVELRYKRSARLRKSCNKYLNYSLDLVKTSTLSKRKVNEGVQDESGYSNSSINLNNDASIVNYSKDFLIKKSGKIFSKRFKVENKNEIDSIRITRNRSNDSKFNLLTNNLNENSIQSSHYENSLEKYENQLINPLDNNLESNNSSSKALKNQEKVTNSSNCNNEKSTNTQEDSEINSNNDELFFKNSTKNNMKNCEELQNEIANQNIEELFLNSKLDENSDSKTNSSSESSTKNEHNDPNDKIVCNKKQSTAKSSSGTGKVEIQYKTKKIKELKRIERKLLKEKRRLDLEEKSKNLCESIPNPENLGSGFMSIVDPIKIKINCKSNIVESKTDLTLSPKSNELDELSPQNSKTKETNDNNNIFSSQGNGKDQLSSNESIKINLGELVRSCKSKLGLLENSQQSSSTFINSKISNCKNKSIENAKPTDQRDDFMPSSNNNLNDSSEILKIEIKSSASVSSNKEQIINSEIGKTCSDKFLKNNMSQAENLENFNLKKKPFNLNSTPNNMDLNRNLIPLNNIKKNADIQQSRKETLNEKNDEISVLGYKSSDETNNLIVTNNENNTKNSSNGVIIINNIDNQNEISNIASDCSSILIREYECTNPFQISESSNKVDQNKEIIEIQSINNNKTSKLSQKRIELIKENYSISEIKLQDSSNQELKISQNSSFDSSSNKNIINNQNEPSSKSIHLDPIDDNSINFQLKKVFEMKEKNKKLIEEMRLSYDQLIKEIKFNNDLKLREIMQESVNEKLRLRFEFERKLKETKLKQWCSNCGNEAIYYCCWNTAYCDEECQKIHWNQHLKICTRIANSGFNDSNLSLNHSNDNVQFSLEVNNLENQTNQKKINSGNLGNNYSSETNLSNYIQDFSIFRSNNRNEFSSNFNQSQRRVNSLNNDKQKTKSKINSQKCESKMQINS